MLYMSSPLLSDHRGPVTILTLNRPERRNALGSELVAALIREIGVAETSNECRAIVIAGAGDGFCAGLDLKEAQHATGRERLDAAHNVACMLKAIRLSSKITFAAVHGAARAGGAGIVAACDLAIATSDATFGYPEVRRGLVPALVGALLRRQISERAMRELFLVAEPIDATRALQLGLINRVVDGSDSVIVREETLKLASNAIAGAPQAIAATKRLIDDLQAQPFETEFETALKFHDAARASDEAAEGIAAFVERREPRWSPIKTN